MLSPLELFEQRVLEQIEKPKKEKILNDWNNLKLNGISNPNLEIKMTPNKGMGVFAKKDFNEGDIIEYAYCIIYDWRSKYQNDSTIRRYSYVINCNCLECSEHGFRNIQPLGYGSIYNSAETEKDRNANYYIFDKERFIAFEAQRDIIKGEEILLWFGQSYYDSWITNLKNKNKVNK